MKIINRDYRLATLKAEVLKTLSHPTRLFIVEMLAKGEKCVCELNRNLEVDHSTISKHLSVLKKAGVVSGRKEGLKVYYRLEAPCIVDFIKCITNVIEVKAKRDLSMLKRRGF
ncbi:MAG: transcriptional regulator [candidate division Zixibacteria bacterium 4484_95]|nr:MAG: transcriptional regulator [candidate division Zixibacteria bacterium 4484_95]